MAAAGKAVGRERFVLLALLAFAGLGCLLGLVAEPPQSLHGGKGEQLLDLARIVATASLAIALLLGPGVVWRILDIGWRVTLPFLLLPGLLLLVLIGGLAWAFAGWSEPRVTCFAICAPTLGVVLGALLAAGPEDVFDREEQHCLLVFGCVLGLAIARAIWSLGPEGELYGGTISRTLEVGDRSDSRISYIIPQLVAHDAGPYEPLAASFFAPYNFSSRGPLPGLGSTPIVLLSGGHPPAELPEMPWAPFDFQGFMAYRIAMMTFACTAFVALWDLVRRLAGRGAARFAVLLAATSPFLIHEVWFTWPKMLAAAFVLMAGICIITRRPLQAGLLAGLGYLMHPVALLSLPALGLLALFSLRGVRWNAPRIIPAVLFVVGIAGFLIAWRLLNGPHYSQSGFLEYFTEAGWNFNPSIDTWLTYRLESVGNTLVPLLLPLASATNSSINVVGGISPGVVHFFFQYWDTLPFGMGLVFFPLLIAGLWHALRRWPWPVTATVVAPFALFGVYWGASSTGMMREGLQAWTLTLVAVLACQQAAAGFGWLRSRPLHALLTLRAVEVLAMAILPTLLTRHELISATFPLTDAVAVAAMVGLCACLAKLVWSEQASPTTSRASERR
jgi:hypothetical protein